MKTLYGHHAKAIYPDYGGAKSKDSWEDGVVRWIVKCRSHYDT